MQWIRLVSLASRRHVFSVGAILVASAASLGTTQPPPDWTVSDAKEGVVTLQPDATEVAVRLQITSSQADTRLEVGINLDPVPSISNEAATTPTVLFATVDARESIDGGADDGGVRSHLGWDRVPTAVTTSDRLNGPHGSTGSQLAHAGTTTVVLRFAWPEGEDFSLPKEAKPARTPRVATDIHWNARAFFDGYGERPADGAVTVGVP